MSDFEIIYIEYTGHQYLPVFENELPTDEQLECMKLCINKLTKNTVDKLDQMYLENY